MKNNPTNRSRYLTKIGLSISAIWLLVAIVFSIILYSPDITLNEWGDFLSGTAGPLALVWLVLGYFQQREELALNTYALLMQRKELERSTQEQSKMTSSVESQTKILLSRNRAYILPKVVAYRVDDNSIQKKDGISGTRDFIEPSISIVNYGSAPARDVNVTVHYHPLRMHEGKMVPDREIKSVVTESIFSPGETAEPRIDGPEKKEDLIQAPKGSPDFPDYAIWIKISYKNMHGYPDSGEYKENLFYAISMNIVEKRTARGSNSYVSSGINVRCSSIKEEDWLSYK